MKDDVFYFNDEEVFSDFAKSCNAIKIREADFLKYYDDFIDSTLLTLYFRNKKVIDLAKKVNIEFYNFDNGYFGNLNSYYKSDVKSYKYFNPIFYRIIRNGTHFSKIKRIGSKRYSRLKKRIRMHFGVSFEDILKSWKTHGNKILICPPSKSSSKFYNLDYLDWPRKVYDDLRQYTDMEILIREKPRNHMTRLINNPIQKVLDQNIYATVTYASKVSVDSIIHGVPSICLGPNGASSMSVDRLEDINNLIFPDRINWLKNLSYCQFTLEELKSGEAKELLKIYYNNI